MSDDGPPKGSSSTHNMKGGYPQYAETPMPENGYDGDDDSESELGSSVKTGLFSNTLQILFIAIAIAHLWTVWTVRADINIVLEYQKEHAQQYVHITKLLQNMKQIQWQIVPSLTQ
jgi:hypothetical protein